MIVVFYLKGGVQIEWAVPDPTLFQFHAMVKLIRSDGQFLADSVYIQANEIAAIAVFADDKEEPATIRHRGRVDRVLAS